MDVVAAILCPTVWVGEVRNKVHMYPRVLFVVKEWTNMAVPSGAHICPPTTRSTSFVEVFIEPPNEARRWK